MNKNKEETMKEILMKIRNEEGKVITKGVPEDLVSNYVLIGWEIVKEEKKNEKQLVKENKDKDNE